MTEPRARPEEGPERRACPEERQRRRVYLRTFGCRANQYDTEVIRAMIEASGGEIVTTPEAADAAVFNSCAVTAAAEADLRQSVRRAARRAPALRTVVMGCAAARDDGTIAALPTVQRVVAGAIELDRLRIDQ